MLFSQCSERCALKAAESVAEAESKTKEAEEQTRQLEVATAEASSKVQEALDFLNEVKKTPGQSHGHLWWLSRELIEKQKYLPQSKQQKF